MGCHCPLVPKRNPGRGRPRNYHRQTLNGILYVLKTGCAWEDIPRSYGSPSTCWRRLQEWSTDGTREHLWRTLLGQLDAQSKIERAQVFLDGSFVPAKKESAE